MLQLSMKDLITGLKEEIPELDITGFVDDYAMGVFKGKSITAGGEHALDKARRLARSDEWREAGFFLAEGNKAPVRYEADRVTEGEVAFKYLGAFFGSNERVSELILEQLNKELESFAHVLNWESLHVQLLAGRLCALQKIQYIIRTTPAAATAGVAKLLDEWLINNFVAPLAGIPAGLIRSNETALAIAELPLRWGGLGFLRQERAAPYAYAASMGMARAVLAARAPAMVEGGYENPGAMLAANRNGNQPEVAALLARLPSLSPDSYWEAENPGSLKGLQAKATNAWASEVWMDTILDMPTREEQWRFADMDSRPSKAWMYAVPLRPSETLDNEAVQTYLRLKLHADMKPYLPRHAVVPNTLICAECSNASLGERPNINILNVAHALKCQHRSTKKARNNRHTLLKREILMQFRKVGCKGTAEALVGQGRKMDIHITQGTQWNELLMDTSIGVPDHQDLTQNPITREQVEAMVEVVKQEVKDKAKSRLSQAQTQGVQGSHDDDNLADNGETKHGDHEPEQLNDENGKHDEEQQNGDENNRALPCLLNEKIDYDAIMFPQKTAVKRLLFYTFFRAREQRKHIAYGDLHDPRNGVLFTPVVFSAFGTPSPKSEAILKGLCKKEHTDGEFRVTSALLSKVYKSVSILFASTLKRFFPVIHNNLTLLHF